MAQKEVDMSRQQTELTWHRLTEFVLPFETDNAPLAVRQVSDAVRSLDLPLSRLEQITQATVETIHQAQAHAPETELLIRISITTPINSRANGCWGYFLVARTTDRLSEAAGTSRTTIELFLYQEHAALT